MTLAAAGLALGIVLTGSIPANAVVTYSLVPLQCGARYEGMYHTASGTVTDTINNGPSAWGRQFPYTSAYASHNFRGNTHVASSMYISINNGVLFRDGASGCWDTVGWS